MAVVVVLAEVAYTLVVAVVQEVTLKYLLQLPHHLMPMWLVQAEQVAQQQAQVVALVGQRLLRELRAAAVILALLDLRGLAVMGASAQHLQEVVST